MRQLLFPKAEHYYSVLFHELTHSLGLTQEELGERLGVRKTTVWRWEHEHRHISESIARLVHYLEKEVKAERRKRK